MTELLQESQPFYCQATNDSYLHTQATPSGGLLGLSNSPVLNSNSTLFFPTQNTFGT